jgi:hypothetical protein
LSVPLGILLALGSLQSARRDAQITDRDIAVFREVVRAGLIPEADVGDRRVGLPGNPVESTPGVAALAVVSQTLRLCRTDGDDVACVPAAALYSMRVKGLAQAKEIDELTVANPVSLKIPAQRILTIPYDHVFRNARSWSDVWSFDNQSNIPECVQVTAPVYGEGNAIVYVQRLWKGRGYGWLVRLKAVEDQWRVVTTKQVWASHPTY